MSQAIQSGCMWPWEHGEQKPGCIDKISHIDHQVYFTAKWRREWNDGKLLRLET